MLGAALLLAPLAAGAQAQPASAQHAPAPAIDTELDALRGGNVVARRVASQGSNVRSGYAAVLVQRPLAQVVAAIHDVNRYREYLPEFQQSQQIRRTRGSQELFVRVGLLNNTAFAWARVVYTETVAPSGAVVIDGRAVQSNLQSMQLRWRATPVEGGAATVLELWALVLPSLPIPLPASMLEREQERAATRAVQAMRRRAEAPAPGTL